MGNENNGRKRPPRAELVAKLISVKGNTCPICGVDLDPSTCTIDYIVPVSLGGNDEIENLQLLCGRCNRFKSNKPFLGYQFESYIQQLIEANPHYAIHESQLKLDGSKKVPDLMFFRRTDKGDVFIVAEVAVAHSFTENSVLHRIQQLNYYREQIPGANLAFITPGELPQKYVDLICGNNIELWDKAFIGREFEEQIETAHPSSFKIFFQHPNKPDVIDVLITELKTCPLGASAWGVYQKLVGRILETLFCPPLDSPISQSSDNSKKNRRDFVMPNYAMEAWQISENRVSSKMGIFEKFTTHFTTFEVQDMQI